MAESPKIYMVIQDFPFDMHYRMIRAFRSEEDAAKFVEKENALLSDDDKPEHDEYGLVSGIEYQVIPIDLY